MKRAFNRAIAMLLVLFIVFPMLPVSVLAEQSTTLQGVGSVHTVTFESDQPASYLVADGKSIETMPEAPEKTAADFIGWYDGETEITAPFTPQADMTIVPKYDAWDARTLDAQVDGATVTLSGVMPSDVSLTVTDHLAEQPVQLLKIAPKKSAGTAVATLSVDEKVSLYSLDIGMQKNDATEYQPDAETPIRVTIAGEKIASAVSEGRALNVTHTLDDGTAEQIADLTVQGETVSFSVTHFSTFDVDAVWNMTSVDTELMDGVSLSGTMPSGVRANAAPAEVEDALLAAELSFTNYDHDVQPAAWGGSMTVTMHSDAIAQAVHSGAEMKALRVNGDTAEELDIAVHEDGSVSFAADAHSVYAVTATTLNQTVTTSDGATYDIEVTYTSAAGIPMEGTALHVEEVLPSDAAYASYLDASASRLGTDTDHIELSRMFDIHIVDAQDASKVYEPAGNVDVSIRLVGSSLDQYANVSVLHFAETDPEETKTVSIEENLPDEIHPVVSEEIVKFTTGSFSVFVVAGYTLEKTIEASDGNTYRITVEYDEDCGIPEGADLVVTEVAAEDYAAYLTSAAQAVGEDVHSVSYGKLFDISIEKDGVTYQPGEDVRVKVELLDAAESHDIRVVHFEDANTPKSVASSTEGQAVTFETDGFSVFSFLDFSLLDHIVTALFGEKTGTLYENDDIILSGSMPALGTVEAKRVDFTVDGREALAAYDIKIYANSLMKSLGIAWQPSDKVQVTIKSDALNVESVDVYHQADEGAEAEIKADPELVSEDLAVEDHSVTFAASSFSVYVVIDHEGGTVVNPRVEFHFISDYPGNPLADSSNSIAYYASDPYYFKNLNNDDQTTQILKNGEKLELIVDPGNKSENYFYGWYVVAPYVISETTDDYGIGLSDQKLYYTWPENPERITFESPIAIMETFVNPGSTVNWSLNGVSGSGLVDGDGNVHVFLAPLFEKYHFVNFMLRPRGSTSNNLMTRKLTALGSASLVEVKISDVRSNSTDPVHLIFAGWEYYITSSDTWVTKQTVDYSGASLHDPGKDGVYLSVAPENESIDLYPVFVEARWVDFFSGVSGSGASYVSSRFLESWGRATELNPPVDTADRNVFTSLDVSTRAGYDFGGWYAFAVTDPDTGEITNISTPADVSVSYLSFETDGNYVTNTVTVRTTAVKITDADGSVCNSGTWSVTDNGDGTGTLSNNDSGSKLIQASDGKLRFFDPLDRLKLCAAWNPVSTQVTVVYWTENVQDQGYTAPQDETDDYTASAVKVITTSELNAQSGTIGSTFASGSALTLSQLALYTENSVGVLDRTYLDDAGAVLSGEEIFYDLNTNLSDASVTITGDGSAMMNVYFSRKVFTLVFHIGRDGYISTSGEQTASNNGSWLQMFYNDDIATGYDAEGASVPGKRGASMTGNAVITYNGTSYTSDYATTAANILNSYLPSAGENVYTIRAKYGAYIGDRWPTPTNPAFTFTDTVSNKDMYTWSAYYDSRFAKLANDRKGSGQNWHPDINGVYSHMSAELCSTRDGTAIINGNQVHHLVAYFGDSDKAGIYKNYHILYKAVDGTYDPDDSITIVPGTEYIEYDRTTWAVNVAHADPSLLNGSSFYEVSAYQAISNLPPESQLASEIDGYELIYSCYNTPNANEHHIYFMYSPKQYTLTFNLGSTGNTDTYYYTQTLENADRYTDEVVVPEGYYFKGWYTNTEGVGEPFDFANETMPSQNLVLYPVLKILQYTIKIDPNGGVLDHTINSSVATYFTADYGTPIGEYSTKKEYIQLSEKELDVNDTTHYYTGTKYYYINMQRLGISSEGDWGLPADLRNAVYVAEDELDAYYDWYCNVINSADKSYWTGISILSKEEFIKKYASYPYRPVYGEHYTFMGWYEVLDDGSVDSMPYNFNDPITGPLELRAQWRLDGGYYIEYNPYFLADDGSGNITVINGEVQQWTDPSNPTERLYADQSPTHILHAPTNITAGWVFSGWRVVKADGEKSFTDVDGTVRTYTDWVPYEDLNYYQPGDSFNIDADLVTEVTVTGKVIHMQAYYEPETSSSRRPYITNLTLDANDPYGGYVDTTAGALPDLDGQGSQRVNTETELDSGDRPTQILIGDLQSNLALHLYRYTTDKTYAGTTGTKFFLNSDNYFLLGFDENSDPEKPTTGKPYIPAFAADAVAAVTRDDDRTLYVLWEPMVYVTFVNTTGVDLVINLSGTGAGTVSVVNEVTGEFDREQKTSRITVPAKSGDTNGQVKIVLPDAVPGTDSVTATAVNSHLNYRLSVSGTFGTVDPYGTGSENAHYSDESSYTGVLQTDPDGIIVTYTEEEEPSLVFDVNGGTWQETDASFTESAVDADIYMILQTDVESIGRYEPAAPTRSGLIFIGWTTNEDIAAQTDFSSTSAVTWGNTTVTPDAFSNVLEKVRDEYLWDFSQEPPYGQTLYAVWSDMVTLKFDLLRTGSKLHSWTGPDTADTDEPYCYYCGTTSQRYVTYTVAKGEKVPKPQDPTADTSWGEYAFLDWVTSTTYTNTSTTPAAIRDYLFDFTEPLETDTTIYTSWIRQTSARKYTYTVRNEIEGGSANTEFDYTITAYSSMNYSGTYYNSDPTMLPVTTRLKNNETYTIEVTAVRYSASGWNHNSLYVVITDRNGIVVSSGHLIEYQRNANTVEYETSDYQVVLNVAQTAKDGYTTTVTAPAGTTVNPGTQSYTIVAGKNNTTSRTITTDTDSFTFRSSNGNTGYVGTNENNSIGTNYADVAETIVFRNVSSEPIYPAPTGYDFDAGPYIMLLGLGAILGMLRLTGCRRRRKEE